jgi:hypothetical protein
LAVVLVSGSLVRFPPMRIELMLFIACLLSIKYWPPIKAALYTKMIYSCKCGYYSLSIPPENVGPGIEGFPDIVRTVLGSAFAECPKMCYFLNGIDFWRIRLAKFHFDDTDDPIDICMDNVFKVPLTVPVKFDWHRVK